MTEGRLRNMTRAAAMPVWLAVLSLASVLATSVPALAQSGVPSPRDAAEVFVAATAAGDAESIAGLYAPDALMVVPGAAPISGRDAIKAIFARNFSLGRNAMAFSTVVADAGSDRAAVYWEWTSEIVAPSGAAQRTSGRSLVYFRKSGESWMISADMMQIGPGQ
jgi:uncharacterized protein (TIGR02246 family)